MSGPTSDSNEADPRDPQVGAGRSLTWGGLLAHWTALAQASLALPPNAEGQRWRDAIPAIIGLQSLTHALAELDSLAPGEDRAVAQDLAAVGIQSHAATLNQLWRSEELHPELLSLMSDARAALDQSRAAGVEWIVASERLVVDHPGELVEALIAAGFDGDLFVPVPGTALFPNSPAAFCRAANGSPPDSDVTGLVRQFLNTGGTVTRHARAPGMRQVYRQFDFGTGRVVRDLVQWMNAELPAGQAQLVPAIMTGRPYSVTLPIRGMAELARVPVEFAADRLA